MLGELSRIERAALQKLHERGGSLRIDAANPNQRGMYWLLENLAKRGYVAVSARSGSVIGYQLQTRAQAAAERDETRASFSATGFRR